MRRLANNENGGLLTFGVAGALWSSSAALVSIVGALNRAYDIEEGRPWWKVRLVAIGLTLGRGADRPDRVVAGARRTDARREARTDDRLGRALRVDVAGPAVAAGVRPRRDGDRAHLLLRTGRGSGLGRGSRQAPSPPRFSGWWSRSCSSSTWPTSPTTKAPTAPSAASSSSCSGSTSQASPF